MDGTERRMDWRRVFIRGIVVLLCAIGVTRFFTRGPMHGIVNSGDFSAVYAASRAWMHGMNPYDPAALARAWDQAGGPADQAPDATTLPSVYPIPIFPLLSPVAMFRWPMARWIWCGINVLAMAVLLECVRRLAGFHWSQSRMLLLAAIALMLRPMSSAVALGQMSLVVTALGALAMLGMGAGRKPFAGILEAIGIALKAPLAAAFVVPDLMSRRWKSLVILLVILAALTGIAVTRAGNPSTWAPDWLHNVYAASTAGGVNDPSILNPSRHQLINLQYPLATSIFNPIAVNMIAVIIAIILMTPALMRLRSRPVGPALLLPVGLVCLVELLVMYHRMYDATVLIFPLAWALLPTTRAWHRWPALLLLAVFIAPGSAPLAAGSINQLWLWNHLILPRDALAIFFLAIWLAWCQVDELRRRALDAGRHANVERPTLNVQH